MSGETEEHVSGWTVDTLHSHLSQRLADTDRLLSRRMDDADKAINAALASAEKAVVKAEIASEKRFEGVNEFRGVLQDQQRDLLRRSEYITAHEALVDRVDALTAQMKDLELKLTTRLERGEGTTAGATGQRTEVRANTGTIIAVGLFLISLVTFILLYVAKR